MSDEKARNRNTDAQKAAVKKYMQTQDEIKLRLPKGSKDNIKAHADKVGKSINGYIADAITEQMMREDNM